AGNQCEKVVKSALEIGYRHIDTASAYANHVEIGQAIKGFPRDKLFLVSKIIGEELKSSNVRKACIRILEELDTPYLDLLLIHWPNINYPADETLSEMNKLKKDKLIRNMGVSNFQISHFKELKDFAILTNQIELHPYL